MDFNRGTFEQFEEWEQACKIAEEIPLDGSGKINQVNGVDAPNNQRTIKYAVCTPNPTDPNDVIWNVSKKYPVAGVTQITLQEAIELGFIPEIEV